MRIIAASFMSEGAAITALGTLEHSFPTSNSLRLAPLGRASDPTGPSTILAGRFADDVLGAVRFAIEELGGSVVADVDERDTGHY